MPDEAVSNSGPLIHLSQIGKFNLFEIFSKVYIPNEVYIETSAFDLSLKYKIDKAKNIETIHLGLEDFNHIIKKIKKYDLDPGELEAIFLCHKLGKKLFFTDDLDAREASLEVGLDPHGSVGIIVLAYRKKYINLKEAEQSMYDLYEISNLFITRSLIEIGIAELKKHG
jgi:hypothetical protein